jgi:lipopolysaccharide transport system ATP-binding protein
VIRTITGVDVAGSVYPSLGKDSLDVDGGAYCFEVEFDCLLNPGTFFLSFALQASDGSLHHRIIDALPFRVSEEAERASTALVDLNVRATHRLYAAELNLEVSNER